MWSAERVDEELKRIMQDIFEKCARAAEEHGVKVWTPELYECLPRAVIVILVVLVCLTSTSAQLSRGRQPCCVQESGGLCCSAGVSVGRNTYHTN